MFIGLLAFIAIILACLALSSNSDLQKRIAKLELELLRLKREMEAARDKVAASPSLPEPAALDRSAVVEVAKDSSPKEAEALTRSATPAPAVPPTGGATAKPISPPPVASASMSLPPIMARGFPELSPTEAPPVAPVAPPPVAKGSFEMRLGTYWLVRVGIVMLLTGLVFFGNYAYENFIVRLGPGGKLALLYLASGVLLALGAWWQRRTEKPGMRNYAQVLFAGGLAAVYFTTYAAHYVTPLRVIESAVVAGALLLAWAGFIAWIADRRKSEILAIFAVGLAYYSSIITRVGAFTLYSNLLLTAVVIAFLVRNRWAGLSFASLVATYVGYGFWRFYVGGDWAWEVPGQSLGFGAAFLTLYWVAFTAATFLSKAESLSGQTRALFLTLNNGAFFTLYLLTLRQAHSDGFWRFALVYGAALLGLTELAKRLLPEEPLTKSTYLTQGLLLVTLGFISKFAGLQLALVLGAESVTLYLLGTQRRSLILQYGGGVVAALAAAWALPGLEADRGAAGVWLGAGLGALLVVNSWWAHRQHADQPDLFRPVPGYFAALAMSVWLAATYFHAEDFALTLAVEGVVATLAIYWLRVREITVLAQLFVVIAQVSWIAAAFAAGAPRSPWWQHALMTVISLGLGHWWQRQRVLSVVTEFLHCWLLGYALALVALVFVWVQPLVDAPVWLALTTLLALGFTGYGVVTRWWWVAATGQLFLGVSVQQFLEQVSRVKPEWCFPLAPIFALGFLAVATVRWLAVRPASSTQVGDVLYVLARWYRWTGVVLSIWWVLAYIPVREVPWVLAALGVAAFALAGWRRNREVLIFSAAYTAIGLWMLWWPRRGATQIYLPNLLAILALLGQQQVARLRPERFNLDSRIHTTAILTGSALLWWFLSRAVMRGGGGFLLTASWSGLALILFGLGVGLRERMYRWAGLGVLGAALGRVVFVDVWRQPTLYRVLTFMALGVVLLVLGFVYNKYQDKIRKWL